MITVIPFDFIVSVTVWLLRGVTEKCIFNCAGYLFLLLQNYNFEASTLDQKLDFQY